MDALVQTVGFVLLIGVIALLAYYRVKQTVAPSDAEVGAREAKAQRQAAIDLAARMSKEPKGEE